MAYVRTVKTASGATAVQIVWSSRRGSRSIEHRGSAHDEAELAVLKAAAAERLSAGQAVLDLGVTGPHGSEPLPITSSQMTHLYFETDAGDGFREPGFSKERRLEPKITLGLLTDASGFPLTVEAFEGNRAETATMLPVLNAFKAAHQLSDVTVVADDRAITWVRQQKALLPDKPFFIYFAPGATHAPHQVPKQWSDKYKGKFDNGWDMLREKIIQQQKTLGVLPENAELTKRHAEIPAWDDMPEKLKPVLSRQMEIYAGFFEQTDYEVGRLLDAIDDLGVLENTLVYYILGDNGASAEGTINGCFNEMTTLNGMPAIETEEFLISKIDEFGTPEAYNHYAVGWAHALCAPYQWTKQVASHWGGTRNGTIVHWPAGLADHGATRNQFHHVIDVAPTILEAAGIPAPLYVNGIQQSPLEGVSMLGTLRDSCAPESHVVQYFEMMGNRGIYHNGWTAATKHRTPWKADTPPPFDDDVWELYEPDDWTQAHDRAAKNPEKLAELQRLWLIEAVKYNVVPLDDRGFERINADIAGRPQLIRGNSQLLFDRMRLSEHCVLVLKNKSYSVTANVEVPESGASGVIVTQGGSAGGWSLYAHEGKLKYCFNFFGIEHYITSADKPIPAGKHQVRMEFSYDGGGLAKGGDVALFYDGEAVGTGRVEKTQPMGYSADEACDVGADTGSPASPDYGPTGNRFTGKIEWVQLDIGDDSHDHLITPEQRLNLAMGRQ